MPTKPSHPSRHRSDTNSAVGLSELFATLIDAMTGRRSDARRRHRRRRHRASRPTGEGEATLVDTPDIQTIEEAGAPPAARMRREWSLRQLGAAACVLPVLLWLAWIIVAKTAASNLADSNPEAAVAWRATESEALDRLALRQLDSRGGNLDAARAQALAALGHDPSDATAVAVLGLVADRKGDKAAAERLMRVAGERSWRDRMTQAWLFNNAFHRGDYAEALPHVDAMLRVDPGMEAELLPVLAAFTVNAKAFDALAAFLVPSPPWREWLLREFVGRLADDTRLIALFDALQSSKSPPTRDELRPYLNRLVKDQKFTEAETAWRKSLPRTERGARAYLFNSDFELPIDGAPFNWVLDSVSGADIQVVDAPDSDVGRALRVEFSGARVRFRHVRQLLMLPPGNYEFSGRVKLDHLVNSRGLWWRVFCAGDGGATLGVTPLEAGTRSWKDFTAEFTVPAERCRGQWLQLEIPARVDSEWRIEGQVWYRGLRITPVAGPPASPEAAGRARGQ